ncbi:hypothetical protein E8E12_001450 [Didymella heteroderae]|uniref:F-box domain-containing protein n=1 Tax=Didymella heteroderae TaxID=1769908 RepID=A0A9P4WH56_9PLEO|nr:hypothetical protein E8E12_001450 [Didymella heteroderae]
MASPDPWNSEHKDPQLPSWLASHLTIDWNSDDIDALLTSIDASQSPQQPALPHLPAELLLLILEHVPAAYTLDWRLVCRGFRDAIDGPVSYHQLQRLQIIGYLGPRSLPDMRLLGDDEYERLHLMPTRLQSMGALPSLPEAQQGSKPPWASTHAVFKMRHAWFAAHKTLKVPRSKSSMLSQISLRRTDQAYGTLTWMIKLDTAVLDLDLPLEPHRRHFDFDVDVKSWTLRLEWKPMLFRFLKTERALRLVMDKKQDSSFTFSHAEDCLRAVRRQGLHAALDRDSRIDRHLKWSLRLLRPLWGIAAHRDPSTLDPVESDAVRVLLLLRRKASLSTHQIRYLYQLASDYNAMVKSVEDLAQSFRDFKRQLIMPGHSTTYEVDVNLYDTLPVNAISWSDELRAEVETRVQKWKAIRRLVEQMHALMTTSHETLTVPEDAFDVLDSEL